MKLPIRRNYISETVIKHPYRTFFVAEFPLHPSFAGDLPSEATPQIAGKVEAQEAQVGLVKWQLDLLVSCSSGEKKARSL